MAQSNSHHEAPQVQKFVAPQSLKTISIVLIAVGILTFIVGLMKNPDRMWTSYLVSFFFFACMGVGGLFWVSLQNTVNAGWSVSVRRYAEAMTSYIPFMIIASLLLVVGANRIFPWTSQELLDSNPVVAAKAGYLNTTFLVIRLMIFGLGCWGFKKLIVGNSLKQDITGDDSLTTKSVPKSVAFLVFFTLAFTMFSMDLMMSLLPTWYSTIFGIYCFAGLFQSFAAFLALVIIYMKRKGFVKGYVTVEHLHDVVKYEKAFTVFWAYIAFSQFMLQWYANIPEETEYYIMRSQNGWMAVSLGLLFFRFIVPFLALLPRSAKRNENHVIAVSVLILIMQYVDIFWMVYPNYFEGHMTFGFWEIGIFAGFAGVFLTCMINFFTKHSIVAVKDPRINEALNHHVSY